MAEEQMPNADRFFLVVPPGFEKLAVAELNEKTPGLDIVSQEKGGILVEAPLQVALAFTTLLKIPTSIRLRIAEFKSRDFPRLFNQVQSVRWNKYLVGSDYELSVECSKSRLNNEKRVEETVREGITRFFSKQPPKKPKKPYALKVHVRYFDDVCSISLDLCGEPLFKRGYKVMAGLAPIRENLAAGLFYYLWSQTKGQIDTLIDPMCGTGSFLLEGQLFFKKLKAREYAYENKPDWVAAEIEPAAAAPKYYYGFDENEKVLQSTRESAEEISKLTKLDLAAWNLEKRDLFADDTRLKLKGENRAVICNPPYGERLKLGDKPESYYPNLQKAILQFEPKILGVIVPQKFVRHWPKTISGYKTLEPIEFSNGGIDVVFLAHSR